MRRYELKKPAFTTKALHTGQCPAWSFLAEEEMKGIADYLERVGHYVLRLTITKTVKMKKIMVRTLTDSNCELFCLIQKENEASGSCVQIH